MTTINIGEYPLHIVENDEDYEPEPFSITVRFKQKEDSFTLHAVCNDLPCTTCAIATECDNGANLTKYLANNLKDLCPEIFI